MSKEIIKILEEVYKENVFSKNTKEKIRYFIKRFIQKLQREIKKREIDAEVSLGGSSAKGTFLKNDFDCDIFVRFDYDKYSKVNTEISDILEIVVKHVTKNDYERVHGSRDYFQHDVKYMGINITFEMIPVIYVNDTKKALNVTDVSPLHVEWIKKHIKKNPNLIKNIVIAKLFFKANGLYGAESYIKGFSGHVTDILISYYASFYELLKVATSWEKNTVLDIEKHYKNTDSAMKNLNASKKGPLVLIDPVQPERNAAASLSLEKFELFKLKAFEFLDNPAKSFFKIKKFNITSIKKKKILGTKKIILKAKSLDGKKDVVGSKLLKTYEHILKISKHHNFEIEDSDWHWNKDDVAYFWFFFTDASLEEIHKTPEILHSGPPVKRKKDVEIFKEKHEKTFEENGRIYAKVKRKFKTLHQLFFYFCNDDDYVLQRVKEIEIYENE